MDIQNFEIFAELSVAILGFSGLAAVLGDSGSNHAYVAARVHGLLVRACIAAISSILPLTGLNIVYCSMIFIVLLIAAQGWAIFGLMRQKSARPSWVIFFTSLLAMLVGVVVMAYGIIEAPVTLVYGYVYSICVVLFSAGLFFVRMVLAITSLPKGN